MSALDLFDDTVAPSERPSLQDGARIHMNTTCNAFCIDDKAGVKCRSVQSYEKLELSGVKYHTNDNFDPFS
jgi:hypothetical protein